MTDQLGGRPTACVVLLRTLTLRSVIGRWRRYPTMWPKSSFLDELFEWRKFAVDELQR